MANDQLQFSLAGIGRRVQLGKRGGQIYYNTTSQKIELINSTSVGGNPTELIQAVVADPIAPYDAVNLQSMPIRKPVRFVSTANLVSFTNITPVVLNASLDDGSVTVVVGDRILVNAQNGTTPDSGNGIYDVVDNGGNFDLVRVADLDEDLESTPGQTVAVYEGPNEADSLWMMTSPDSAVIIGTSPLLWQKISSAATGNFIVDGTNLGGGEEVFKQKAGSNFEFRTLVAGANVFVTQVGDTLEISANTGGPGSGEINNGVSLGTSLSHEDVFVGKNGLNLEFNAITPGTGISLDSTSIPGEIIINSTASAQNLYETVQTDGTSVTATSPTDTLNIVGGAFITTSSPSANTVQIDAVGVGGPIEILDNNVSVTSAVQSIDFTGTGFTISNVGNDVTINLSGAGGGTPLLVQEEGINVELDTQTLNFVGGNLLAATGASPNSVDITLTDQNVFTQLTTDGGTVNVSSPNTSVAIIGQNGIITGTQGVGTITITGPSIPTLTVQEEGVNEDTDVTTLNFIGDNITASQSSSGVVDITVDTFPQIAVQEESSTVETDTTTLNFVGDNITAANGVSVGTVDITVDSVVAGANVGTGTYGLFRDRTGSTLNFKTIEAGANITISELNDVITIAASGAGGGGEVNNGVNLGAGTPVYAGMSGLNLSFNTLTAGTNVTFDTVTNPGEIIINTTGGGGGTTQNLFETVAGQTGLPIVAGTPTDTLNIIGGTNVTTEVVGGQLIINALAVGGSPVEILDENVQLTTSVFSIDFVGDGVTASNVGNDVTVSIPDATQNVFNTFAGDTGSQIATSPTETLTFTGGNGITTDVTGNTVTINGLPDQNLYQNIEADATGPFSASSTTDTLQIVGTGGASTSVSQVGGVTTLTINSASGGSPIEALDEGLSLTTGMQTINFVGSGVTASNIGNDVTIAIPGSPGGGEANTASNLGTTPTREGLFAQKVADDLQFKSLVPGTDITLTATGDEITINSVKTDQNVYTTWVDDNIGTTTADNPTDTMTVNGNNGVTIVISNDTIDVDADVDGLTITNVGGTGDQLAIRGGPGSPNVLVSQGSGNDATWIDVNTLVFKYDRLRDPHGGITAAVQGGEGITFTEGDGVRIDVSSGPDDDADLVNIAYDHTRIWNAATPGEAQVTFVDTDINHYDDPDMKNAQSGGMVAWHPWAVQMGTGHDGTIANRELVTVIESNVANNEEYLIVTHGRGGASAFEDEVRLEATNLEHTEQFVSNRSNDQVNLQLQPRGPDAGVILHEQDGPGWVTSDLSHDLFVMAGQTDRSNVPGNTFVFGGNGEYYFGGGDVIIQGGWTETTDWNNLEGLVRIRAGKENEEDIMQFRGYVHADSAWLVRNELGEVRMEVEQPNCYEPSDMRFEPDGYGDVNIEDVGHGNITADLGHCLFLHGGDDDGNSVGTIEIAGGNGVDKDGGDVIIRAGASENAEPGKVVFRSSHPDEAEIIYVESVTNADTFLVMTHGAEQFDFELRGPVDTNLDMIITLPVNPTGLNNIGNGPTTGLIRMTNDVEYNEAFEPHDLTTQLDAQMIKRSFEPMQDALVMPRKIYGFVNQTGAASSKIIVPGFEGILLNARIKLVGATDWNDGTAIELETQVATVQQNVLMGSNLIDEIELGVEQFTMFTETVPDGSPVDLAITWSAGGTGRLEFCIDYIGVAYTVLSD